MCTEFSLSSLGDVDIFPAEDRISKELTIFSPFEDSLRSFRCSLKTHLQTLFTLPSNKAHFPPALLLCLKLHQGMFVISKIVTDEQLER